MSDADILTLGSSFAGVQKVAATPRPPEYFHGRKGYQPAFLGAGFDVPLPTLKSIAPEDIAQCVDGGSELKYTHFSTVHCIPRKMPYFSAVNIDGAKLKSIPRADTWCYDGRIPKDVQMLREPYGSQQDKKFSRGHMTRRQDPNWGQQSVAEQANVDTFMATNICPQWQPFNEGLWGDLEDYILGNADGDDKKVSVITGPIFGPNDPERMGCLIPRDFWKVVAFVSQHTKQLAAIGYVMSQGRYFDTGVLQDLEDFQMAQRSLAYIEQQTGLQFDVLRDCDVFAGVDLAFTQPIRSVHDTRLPVGGS